MRHRLQPVTPDDREVLLAVYANTRADELALTDWSAAQRLAFVEMQFDAQLQHYAQQRPQAVCQLIVLADGPAGGPMDGPMGGSIGGRAVDRLWVDRDAESLHVLGITLLPQARGQGLGSVLLRELMAEAQQRCTQLTVSVEIHNRARRLYERLGFEAQGGLQGIYQRMAWQPATLLQLEHQE